MHVGANQAITCFYTQYPFHHVRPTPHLLHGPGRIKSTTPKNIPIFLSIILGCQCHHQGRQCHHHRQSTHSHQLSSGSSTVFTNCHQRHQQVFTSHHKNQMRKNFSNSITCCHLSSVFLAKNFHMAKLPILRIDKKYQCLTFSIIFQFQSDVGYGCQTVANCGIGLTFFFMSKIS